MQLFPGLLICLAFVALAIVWGMSATPRTFGNVTLLVVQHPFFAGGIAALIATIWAAAVLGVRMARTDFAFYHAMLLPTAVAGILALAAISENQFRDWKVDLICAGCVIAVILLDLLLFKYLRKHLIRPAADASLVGDESLILSKIESMLDRDWDRLLPHYVALGPLYTYTGVQAASWQHPALLDRAAEEPDPNELPVAEPPVEAPEPSPEVDPKIQRLVAQIEQRITEAARALTPPAKLLLTALAEYSQASTNRNTALMQTNAAKIEQKGQELTAKLAEFDRLCHSPALSEAGRSDQLRAIANRLAQKAEAPDIQILRTLADYARTFRANTTEALAALNPLAIRGEEIIERLKQS
jgi:energy-converting hydrogenase Eha subunit A